MGIGLATFLMIAGIIGLMLTGLPLAFVTGLIALAFTFGWFGETALALVTTRIYSFINEYVLVAVPMFVLMASILDRSGIARDLYSAMRVWAGGLRGGVAVQTLIAALFLAAMSGIIGGEIVLLGLIALPQMLRLGYSNGIAIGAVCAGGSLGTMIPPSIVLIVYGLTASVSIGDLFLATITPGVLLCLLYIAYILTVCYLNPEAGPVAPAAEREMPVGQKLVLLRGVIVPILVALWVLGSIYGGIASVTEAAAMGVVGVAAAAALRGELTFRMIHDALRQTLNTCGMIVWIGIGASALVGVYNLMGGNRFVQGAITGLDVGPFVIILLMMAILIVLGCFMDWIGIAFLTMPIFVPIVASLGYDPVWFGILITVLMETALITPPIGVNLYVVQGIRERGGPFNDVVWGSLPFVLMMLAMIGILMVFPGLALWLPSLVY
jgi:tripartite ATP-independent transporter DctM subunit